MVNKIGSPRLVLGLVLLFLPMWSEGTAWARNSTARPDEVQDRTFHSLSLHREMRYRIILPPGYEETKLSYPVLYLLHGLGDDERSWTGHTNLVSYVRGLSLIIVMPNAAASWYVDSVAEPGLRYERYIVEDLRKEVEGRFRTDPRRAGRAIAGQSMGGYGAVKIAMRYPEMFAVAGSISGALDAAADLGYFDKFGPGAASQARALLYILGAEGSPTRTDNDPFQLLRTMPSARLPYLYLDCGTGDMQLPANHRFVARLEEAKVAFEFHEYPGEHEWAYWNGHIPLFLALVASQLEGAGRSGSPGGSGL